MEIEKIGSSGNRVGSHPPLLKGGEGGFYMRNFGLRVLRFSDREVFENIEGVIEKIGGKI